MRLFNMFKKKKSTNISDEIADLYIASGQNPAKVVEVIAKTRQALQEGKIVDEDGQRINPENYMNDIFVLVVAQQLTKKRNKNG